MKKIIVLYFIIVALANGKDENLKYTDIPKDHWAYKAVQNLVNEGVITENSLLYKGDDTVSRYDFADGLNRAFKKLNKEKANKGDLIVLESLVYEFSKELTKIGFDENSFNVKIEGLREEIEKNSKKIENNTSKIEALEERIKILENNS